MRNKRKLLFWICLIAFVALLMLLVSKYFSQEERGDVYKEMQMHNEELSKELETQSQSQSQLPEETKKTIVIPVDFKTLQKENKDIYAWIKIPGTVVDYPILQSDTDDYYYLEHTVEGKKGLPGSIYTESLNSKDFTDLNTIIYGHNMKDGSMFGELALYKDGDYMKEHETLIVYTPEHIYTYKIFAAVTYDNRHILHSFDFSEEEGLSEFLDSIASVRNMHTYINGEVSIGASDRIITLSTCNQNKEQRFLVEAVLIDEQ